MAQQSWATDPAQQAWATDPAQQAWGGTAYPTEEELQIFFLENGIDERAQNVLLSTSPVVQRAVLDGGGFGGSSNPAAALVGRVRAAQNQIGMGQLKSDIVFDADQFIMENGLDEDSAKALKACSYDVQQNVMAKGSLQGTRNPPGALRGRMRDAQNTANGCPGKGLGKGGDFGGGGGGGGGGGCGSGGGTQNMETMMSMMQMMTGMMQTMMQAKNGNAGGDDGGNSGMMDMMQAMMGQMGNGGNSGFGGASGCGGGGRLGPY